MANSISPPGRSQPDDHPRRSPNEDSNKFSIPTCTVEYSVLVLVETKEETFACSTPRRCAACLGCPAKLAAETDYDLSTSMRWLGSYGMSCRYLLSFSSNQHITWNLFVIRRVDRTSVYTVTRRVRYYKRHSTLSGPAICKKLEAINRLHRLASVLLHFLQSLPKVSGIVR